MLGDTGINIWVSYYIKKPR